MFNYRRMAILKNIHFLQKFVVQIKFCRSLNGLGHAERMILFRVALIPVLTTLTREDKGE